MRDCETLIRRVGAIHALPSGELDDFVQEAWLAVLQSLQGGGYDPRRGRWDDWLFIVARNRALTFFRRKWRAERVMVAMPLELLESRVFPDPTWWLDRCWDVEAVRTALGTLRQRTSPLMFAVLYLRHIRQWSVEEVATSLQLSREQVRVYDHRTRRKLATILRRHGLGE